MFYAVRVECDGPRPFTAGLVIDRDTEICVSAAPILRWAIGLGADELRRQFAAKGFRATRRPYHGETPP